MKRISRLLAAALLTVAAWPAQAALNVLACEPEWASLATELGGDLVKASSATTAQQDPHRIEARPSLIARTRNADLVLCTGLELEAGWLPMLLRQAGNAKVMPGQGGLLELGPLVDRLDVATRVDRAEGDVHAAGNPHIQLDPRNFVPLARAVAARLAALDPANAAQYEARHKDFATRWSAALQRWNQQGALLKGVPVVEHHRNMAYLLHWLAMRSVGTLEPKPGIEPSAAHLNQLLAQLQQQPAKMVLYAAYQDGGPSRWLSERARIPAVELPFTVGGSPQAKDLFGLFDDSLARLLAAAGSK